MLAGDHPAAENGLLTVKHYQLRGIEQVKTFLLKAKKATTGANIHMFFANSIAGY